MGYIGTVFLGNRVYFTLFVVEVTRKTWEENTVEMPLSKALNPAV